MVRNQIYTKFDDVEVELGRLRNGDFHLISRHSIQPDATFHPIEGADGFYVKNVLATDIENSYKVETFAQYAGHKWQVDRKDGDKLRLSIGYNVDLPDVKMVDRGWYETWVEKKKIEKLWEERSDSGYNFPYPEGL